MTVALGPPFVSIFSCHAGAPNIVELCTESSTTVQVGKNVSIQLSAESNPPHKIILRNSVDTDSVGMEPNSKSSPSSICDICKWNQLQMCSTK